MKWKSSGNNGTFSCKERITINFTSSIQSVSVRMSPEPDALAHTKLVPVDNDLQLTASTTERNAPTAPFSGPSSDIDLKNTEGFQEAIHEACGMVDKSTSDLNETAPTNKSPRESVAINNKTEADNAFNTNVESKVAVFKESQTGTAIVAEETSAEVPSFMSGWGGASGWGEELDLDLDDVDDVSVEHDDRGSTEGWGIGDIDISSPSSSKSEASPIDTNSNPGDLPHSKVKERNDLPVESKVKSNEADLLTFHVPAKSESSNFGPAKNNVPAAPANNTVEVEWGEASGWDDELDLNLDDDDDKTADGWSIGEINLPSTASGSAPTSATLQPPEGVDTRVCASTETASVSLPTHEVNVFEGWGLLPSESQSNAIVGTASAAGAAASKLQISLADKEDSPKREPRNGLDSQAISSSVMGTNVCVQSSLTQSSVMPANDCSSITPDALESSPSQDSPYPPSAISSPPVSLAENSSASERVGNADSSELNDLPEPVSDPWGTTPEIMEPPKKSQPVSSLPSVTSPSNELSSVYEPGNSVDPWASTPAQVAQSASNVQPKPQPVGLGIVAKIATSNVYEPQDVHRSTHQLGTPTPCDDTPTLSSTQPPSQLGTAPPQSDSVSPNDSGSQGGHSPVEKTVDPWVPGPNEGSRTASSPLQHLQPTPPEATNSALSSFYDTQNFNSTDQETLDPWAPVTTDRTFPGSNVQETLPRTEVQEPIKNDETGTSELSNSGDLNRWAPASSDTISHIARSDHSGQGKNKPKQSKNVLNSLHSDEVSVERAPPVTEKQDPLSNEQSSPRKHGGTGDLNQWAPASAQPTHGFALTTQSEQGEGGSKHSNDVLDNFYSDHTTAQAALSVAEAQEPRIDEQSSPPEHSDSGEMNAWAPSSTDATRDFASIIHSEQEEMPKYSNDVMNSFYSDQMNVESLPQRAEDEEPLTNEQSSPRERNGPGDLNPWAPSSESTHLAVDTQSGQDAGMGEHCNNTLNSFYSDQINVEGTPSATEIQERPNNEQSNTNVYSHSGELSPWAPTSSEPAHDLAPGTQSVQREEMSKYSNDVMNSFYPDQINVESAPPAPDVQKPLMNEQPSADEHNGSNDLNPWASSSLAAKHNFAPCAQSEQGEGVQKHSNDTMNSFVSDKDSVQGGPSVPPVQEPLKTGRFSINEHSNSGGLNSWIPASSEAVRNFDPSTQSEKEEVMPRHSDDVTNSFYSGLTNVEEPPTMREVENPLKDEQPRLNEQSASAELNSWAPASEHVHDFAPDTQSEQGEKTLKHSNDVMTSFYPDHTIVQGPPAIAEAEELHNNEQSGPDEPSGSAQLNPWAPTSSAPTHDFAPRTQSDEGEEIPKYSNDVMNSFYSDQINVESAPRIGEGGEPLGNEQSAPGEQSDSGQLNPWEPAYSEPKHDFAPSTQLQQGDGTSKYSNDVMNSFYSDQINVKDAPSMTEVVEPLKNEQPISNEHGGSAQLDPWVPASSDHTNDFAPGTQSEQGEGMSKYSDDVMNSFYSEQTNVQDAPPVTEVGEPPRNEQSGPDMHSDSGQLNPWAPASSGTASGVSPNTQSERKGRASEYSNDVMDSFYPDHSTFQAPPPVAEVQKPRKNEKSSTNDHSNSGDLNSWAPASSELTHDFAPSRQSEQGEGIPKYSNNVMSSFYSGQSTGQGPPVPPVQEPLKTEEFSRNEHSNSGELDPWALSHLDPPSGTAPSAPSGQEAMSTYSSNVMNSFYSDQTTNRGVQSTAEVYETRHNEQSIPHCQGASDHLNPWAPASSDSPSRVAPDRQSEQREGTSKFSNDVMNSFYSDHPVLQGPPPIAEVQEPLKKEKFSPRERDTSGVPNLPPPVSLGTASGAVSSTHSRQGESISKYSNDVVNSFYSDQTPIADPWSVEDSANSSAHPIEHTSSTYSPNTSALHPAREPESVSYSPKTSTPLDTGNLWSAYSPDKLHSHYDGGVPASVNNQSAQPFAQSFSIMDSTMSDERRTPRALMTWGFGGSLVVLTHGKASSIYEESSTPTKVRIYDMSTIAQDNANENWTVAVETVAALEPSASNLATYADMCDRLSTYSMGMNRKSSESISYMWRFLATMCRNPKGNWYPKLSDVLGARLSVPLFNHGTNELQLQDSPLRFDSVEEVESQDNKARAAVQIENLLTRGQTADAVNVARSSGLWPLVLIISSSMDQTTFMNAVSEYARESLVNGTALQTLCLSMSQNINELVDVATSAEGVRNWKKTVSVLLNQKGSPNAPGREVRVIEKIGDALSHQEKDLVAAHFCYLISGKIKALSVNSDEIPLLGADSTIPSGRPGSMGSLIPILQSVVYEAIFNAQHDQQFPHLLPFRLQIVLELISVGKLELAYQHTQLIVSSVRALLERRSQVSNLFTAPFLSTLESVEVQLRNRLKGTSDSTGGKLMALKQSISSVLKKSTEAILSTSASVASGMNVPVSSAPVQTDHSAPETTNPVSNNYYENSGQYELRQRRIGSFEQSSPDSSQYGAREPTESFSQNYATSQPSPSFSGSTDPRQTGLPPHQLYGHPQSMPVVSNNFSVPSNQMMNMNVNQTRSSTTATSSTRETVAANETVESKSESGWNSFVANTIKVLAPAEGDLSPPPVSTGTDTFRNMATSPRSQNSSGLSHMRSASMGDVPSIMSSSDTRNLWDQNRRDMDSRRYSLAGFGQSRQFGGSEQSNSSQPQDPSLSEERRSVPGHRRTTSDITHEIQASESRPPRPPRRDNENNDEGRERSRGTGSTWFRRSRFAARLLGAFGAPKQAHMGEENKFVFDKALGRWVIPGEPTPDLDESLAPPPDDDELSNSGFSNFPDSRQQTPDSMHGQFANPSQDASLNDLSNQTLGPSMYGNAPAGYQQQQSQFPSQTAQGFSPPIGAYTESGTLSGNVSVNDSASQNGYGDNMSETSVQSAVSAPTLRRSMLSDVPPPVAPITNRYRAGRAKLSGRRAYVDTFNPGSQNTVPPGIPAPLRPPSQIMSSSSGAGNMKIFTPAPASTEAPSSWQSSIMDESSSVASGNNMQSSGQSNVQSQQAAYSSNNSTESSFPVAAAAAGSEMSAQTSYSTSYRWESSQPPQYRPSRNSAPAPPGPRMSA